MFKRFICLALFLSLVGGCSLSSTERDDEAWNTARDWANTRYLNVPDRGDEELTITSLDAGYYLVAVDRKVQQKNGKYTIQKDWACLTKHHESSKCTVEMYRIYGLKPGSSDRSSLQNKKIPQSKK